MLFHNGWAPVFTRQKGPYGPDFLQQFAPLIPPVKRGASFSTVVFASPPGSTVMQNQGQVPIQDPDDR
jgi:hypothetical protein